MEDRFLKEAIRIADRLLDMAKPTDNGVCWESLTFNNGETTWAVGESIYSGTGGIAYFMMELYIVTKEEQYLDIAKKAIDELWHVHETRDTDYYAFFTGRHGLSYVFLKYHEITGDQSMIDKAVAISLASEAALKTGNSIDDLINGYAGTIVGLLYVHEYTKDDRIIPVIEKYTEKLISKASFGSQGVYWDRASTQSRGLCGFSHGTAGIGYAFLQLGYYFDNPAFYFIAEMAFAYENQYFNSEDKNWPDFRKGFYDEKTFEEFKKEYKDGNKEFFVSSGSMRAWCHGSPGIGLSRVTAVKLIGDKYLDDLKNAVESTLGSVKMQSEFLSYTLCHGVGGNSMLLMEAQELLPDEDFRSVMEEAADAAIAQFDRQNFYFPGLSMHKCGGGTSLFMGDAGIGYFMLALSQGFKSTILKPEVTSQFEGKLTDSILTTTKTELIERFARQAFPESWGKLSDHSGLDDLTPENLNAELAALLRKRLNKEDQSLLEMEIVANELNTHESGNAYLYVRQITELEKIREILEKKEDISDMKIVLPEENKLYEISDEDLRLLVPTHEGVVKHDLNFFTYLIMSKFTSPSTVKEAVESIMSEFEVEDEQQMTNTVTEQARQGLLSGIMFLAD
ncbi:MAG: lanthionine synthetase LanC family protein [Cyclobacteriaceae bacterium]